MPIGAVMFVTKTLVVSLSMQSGRMAITRAAHLNCALCIVHCALKNYHENLSVQSGTNTSSVSPSIILS